MQQGISGFGIGGTEGIFDIFKPKVDSTKGKTPEQFRAVAQDTLKIFWEASTAAGLKMPFADFIKYVDNLSPTFRTHFGKQVLLSKDMEVDTSGIMKRLGTRSKGFVPQKATDLQVLPEAFIDEMQSFATWKAVAWSAKQEVKQVAAVAQAIPAAVTEANKTLKLVAYAVIGVAALYLAFQIKAAMEAAKKLKKVVTRGPSPWQ